MLKFRPFRRYASDQRINRVVIRRLVECRNRDDCCVVTFFLGVERTGDRWQFPRRMLAI